MSDTRLSTRSTWQFGICLTVVITSLALGSIIEAKTAPAVKDLGPEYRELLKELQPPPSKSKAKKGPSSALAMIAHQCAKSWNRLSTWVGARPVLSHEQSEIVLSEKTIKEKVHRSGYAALIQQSILVAPQNRSFQFSDDSDHRWKLMITRDFEARDRRQTLIDKVEAQPDRVIAEFEVIENPIDSNDVRVQVVRLDRTFIYSYGLSESEWKQLQQDAIKSIVTQHTKIAQGESDERTR